MSKITVKQMNEEAFIPILNQPFLYDQSTERKRKRQFQMQKRKADLNEVDVPKIENVVHTTSRCTTELSPSFMDNHTPLQEAIAFIQLNPQMDADAEVNVSDLDCSIESTEEKSKEKIKCDRLVKEYKPFIQLNNNLKYKVNTENKSLSYLLALSQGEEADAKNKAYKVEDVIKEEKENEPESPSKAKTNCSNTVKSKSNVFKSDDYGLIKESINQKVKFQKNKAPSVSKINNFTKHQPTFQKKLKNVFNQKEQKKKLNISTSFYIRKPQQKEVEQFRNNKLKDLKDVQKKHVRSQTTLKPDESFSKILIAAKYQKIPAKKIRIGMNKSINSINKPNQNNQSVCINKKISHRKNATLLFPGKPQSSTKVSTSSSVMMHKKTSSLSVKSNKPIVLTLLEKLRYVSNEHYAQAIQSIHKSKRNVFVMVRRVKDSPSLIFRAAYEVNSSSTYLNQIYSCSFCPYKISFEEMTSGYSYNSQKDIFTKEIKFKKEVKSGMTVQCFTI